MISTEIRATTTRTTTMKAVVQDTYGTSEVLELRDVAKPEIGEREVLVQVRAAGVNPGDWAIMGGLPYIARPVYGLRKPKNRVRGTDVAGQVEAIGAAVTRFRPGDDVFGSSRQLAVPLPSMRPALKARRPPSPTTSASRQRRPAPWRGNLPCRPRRVHGKVLPG